MSREDGRQPTLRPDAPGPSRSSGSSGSGAPRRPPWVEVLAALSRPPRRAARALRNRVDAALHPWRRRRAAQALAGRHPVRRILVLCYGNICRSPYAEYRLREGLEAPGPGPWERPEVTSAGFFGPGRTSPEVAVEAALGRGIDLLPHRSRIVTTPFIGKHDVVFVMTRAQVRATKEVCPDAFVLHLGDFDPGTPSERDIPDPYGHSLRVFSDVYARVDTAVETVVALLRPEPQGTGRP